MVDTPHDWYIKSSGQQFGPFTFSALQEFVQRTQLNADSLVRAGDNGPWKFANSIPKLLPSRSSATPTSGTLPVTPAMDAACSRARPDCWYYRIGELQHGPISLNTLLQLASVSGDTASDIVVRRANDDNWIPLTLAERQVTMGHVVPPVAWCEMPHIPALARPSTPSSAAQSYASTAAAVHQITSKLIGCIRTYASLFVAGGIWLAFSIAATVILHRADATEQYYFSTFQSISNELFDLSTRDPTSDELIQFVQRCERTLKPIIDDLEATASQADPIRQHLLWAGRDYLTPMLLHASTNQTDEGTSEDRRMFRHHMNLVDHALSSR